MVMTTTKTETSPQVYARIGGLAYLIIIVAGAMGEMFIRNKLIVSGDASATMHNIAASRPRRCCGGLALRATWPCTSATSLWVSFTTICSGG